MNPEIAALVLHHIHHHTSTAAHMFAVAHGSEGQGARWTMLLLVAIVAGTILGVIHHTFSR